MSSAAASGVAGEESSPYGGRTTPSLDAPIRWERLRQTAGAIALSSQMNRLLQARGRPMRLAVAWSLPASLEAEWSWHNPLTCERVNLIERGKRARAPSEPSSRGSSGDRSRMLGTILGLTCLFRLATKRVVIWDS